MLRRSVTAWKNRAPEATLPLLFTLLIYSLAPTVADTQPLEFRYGVSQIPNYELKYLADFPHFNYLNVDAPKGGTLVLPLAQALGYRVADVPAGGIPPVLRSPDRARR